MPYTSDTRWFLTADRETAVEEGDPRAAFLLVGVGGQLSDEEAAKYGLKNKPATAENKNKAAAPENKSGLTVTRDESPRVVGSVDAGVDEGPTKKPARKG